ncbi:hypothetical protein SESBI_46381, partial [Sesbania bispinosa]
MAANISCNFSVRSDRGSLSAVLPSSSSPMFRQCTRFSRISTSPFPFKITCRASSVESSSVT